MHGIEEGEALLPSEGRFEPTFRRWTAEAAAAPEDFALKFFEMVEVFAKLCILGRELKVNP